MCSQWMKKIQFFHRSDLGWTAEGFEPIYKLSANISISYIFNVFRKNLFFNHFWNHFIYNNDIIEIYKSFEISGSKLQTK